MYWKRKDVASLNKIYTYFHLTTDILPYSHDIYVKFILQFQASKKKVGGGEESKNQFPGKYRHN